MIFKIITPNILLILTLSDFIYNFAYGNNINKIT